MEASGEGRGGEAEERRGEVRDELKAASCGEMIMGDSGMW